MRRPDTATITGGLAVAVCAVLLAGCSPSPAPTPALTSSASTTPSSTPTPAGPVLVPEGSAEDNLALFTAVMDEVADSKSKVKGRAYVDALADAGFATDDMEVTRDETSVGLPADSIQFSVLWDGECLVGQVGPSTKTPTAVVLPELPGGGCLVGETRPIDW